MPRYAWLTDIHLNFLKVDDLADFCTALVKERPDGLIVSGDIAEGHTLERYLRVLEHTLEVPVWFVLGNHDFYRSSVVGVRALVRQLSAQSPWLHWLPAVGVIELGKDTALVGHDGWADGRCGDYAHSDILLNDYFLISELAGLTAEVRFHKLNALGDEAAAYLRQVLPEALAHYRHVYLAIHNPPFAEACWFQGRQSGPNWLPHLACKAAGDVLLELMRAHQHRELTVLCGHTHGGGEVSMLPNLHVITGRAEYGAPRVQQFLEVD